MEKILVVGVSGMLGGALAKIASKNFDVVGTYNKSTSDGVKLDITNKVEVDNVIGKIKPSLIVNCAAITNVDFCEENPHLAEAVHVHGTKNLSDACRAINAKFVHVSTDFVFSGSRGNYSEDDKPHPVNVYGKTKLQGEKIASSNDLVLRTCIFGYSPRKSMVEWIVDELTAGMEISVFNDSFFTPMYTGHLAAVILEAYRKDLRGLFHVASTERVDKFTFAKDVAEVYGLDKTLIKPSSISTFTRKAKRPADTSLSCRKAIHHGIKLNHFKDEIKMMKHDRG